MPEDTDKSLTHSPKYRYPGEATRATLDAMSAAGDGSKTLRYTSPLDGGPVMPTLDCYYKRITKDKPTDTKRVTHNQICLVVNGDGSSRIGDETIHWSKHDTFTIPHWSWATHTAESTDADFFIVTDKSVFENLDLVRQEIQN